MSQAIVNDCGCPTNTVVEVPGAQGSAGVNGVNAFTVTTADFIIPAIGANVTVQVSNSTWMSVGQQVFASDTVDFGNFQVVSFPNSASVVLKFLGNTGDGAPGATINSGATVSAAGVQGATPANTFANGNTTGTTKATAQTNLGLGQDAIISSATGLTQAITASYLQVSTIAVSIPAAGTYFYVARATVNWTGVTFASSRNISLKIRNVTQGVDLSTAVRPTGILTTTTLPSSDYFIPFIIDATAIAADSIQLLITIDVINSAGTLNVVAGSLAAIPLRKS